MSSALGPSQRAVRDALHLGTATTEGQSSGAARMQSVSHGSVAMLAGQRRKHWLASAPSRRASGTEASLQARMHAPVAAANGTPVASSASADPPGLRGAR